MELGLFQTDALVEKLAKAFYRLQGYVVPESYRMQNSTHPTEKACVAMALVAIEEVEFELAGNSNAEVITWQQGQSLSEDRQYYFCKYGGLHFNTTDFATYKYDSCRSLFREFKDLRL
ncbi:hypothetical protein LC593_34345 [Nostoc sp. CHAB 5844]|nr:hypothetical protein [Nostoc sp. CHAB 5844]